MPTDAAARHGLPRNVVALIALAVTCFASAAPRGVIAQPYPARPVTVVIPFAPGGGTDILGRTLATRLTETMGQQFVADNRAGAGGNIGAQAVANARPDGYTLLLTHVSIHAINPFVYARVPFDPIKSFTPVALFASAPLVMVANNKLAVGGAAELIALARRQPGTLTYGSAGIGSINHLAGELLDDMAGTRITHVPYRGAGPALTDLIAGNIDLLYAPIPAIGPHLKAGKLRAFAITGTARSPVLPEVPTLAEAGVRGYEVEAWYGVMGPAGMPEAVTLRLSQEIRRIQEAADFRKRLEDQGVDPLLSTPEQVAARLRTDVAQWERIIKARGVKAE
jgi:tripartite-type tricarboxylate transporter receptor subunit TctC